MTATFRYRAATKVGGEVRGELRASSARAAIDELRRQSLIPVALEEAERVSSLSGDGAAPWRLPLRNGSDAARAIAIRTIATMVAAGGSLDRALAFAAAHAGDARIAASLQRVHEGIRRGDALSSALQRETATFGALAASVARAGEESGTLDDALARLADQYDRSRELRAQVQQALWYPALMGTVAGLGVLVLLVLVIPRFVDILGETGGTLPASTRLLLAASHAARAWWWAALIAAGGGMFAWRQWIGDAGNRRRWDAARLSWPITGSLERALATARFARALGTLLQGGVGVLAALGIARQAVGNAETAARLGDAASRVSRGEPLSAALDGILPPLATQLLAVGEESGALGPMALRVADEYERETQRALRGLVALVEPTLIILFGGVVGFVALAMLQAVYSINGALR